MEIIVKDGQTLPDIAIQEYGSLEAVEALAFHNNISMTDIPAPGKVLRLPDVSYNRVMADFCKAHEVSPATAREQTEVGLGIFTQEFDKTFT